MINLSRRGVLGLIVGLFMKPKLAYSKYLDIENHGKDLVYNIDLGIKDIVPSFSKAIDYRVLGQLEDSIRKVGLMTRLEVVYKDRKYELVSGFHRLQACKNLGITTVPCTVFVVKNEYGVPL